MSSGKSCWRWPYGSNSFSVHRLQVDTVCVDCCGDDQSSSSLCKCADLQSREKLNQCCRKMISSFQSELFSPQTSRPQAAAPQVPRLVAGRVRM